jgi:fluoroacetyl-CoA thioesterase
MIPAISSPGSLALYLWELFSKTFKGRSKMAKPIPIGARGEARETVEFKHTLTAHHPELPPVYSTPDMIRLMETAAFHALHPYCEGDEITVGTSVNIQHRAASGIGAHIRAEAVLDSFDGRFYSLRVTAHDDAQEIGRGTVGRAVVSVSRFVKKMAEGRRD